MISLIGLHFALAAVAPLLVRHLDRFAFWVMAIAPGLSFVWLLPRVLSVTGDGPGSYSQRWTWIEPLGLHIDFIVSPLTGILALLVSGVGALVLIYCTWYFPARDPGLWRFSAVMTAFAGAMLGLVLADDLLLLYVFWEATSVLSYLLIGHNPDRAANRRAAMNSLLVTTLGGLTMLIGIVVLGHESGSFRISAILADPPAGSLVTVAVVLLAIGAWSKSALLPFSFWLPGAMAAPTPVSAYLHAAAMVKAGVYLVALLAPAFAALAFWQPAMITLGLATMVVGGLRALRQYDLKLLLAYGTVSQLGMLTAIIGAGTRAGAMAGLALLIAHALFKATLFLVVGVVDRTWATRDLRLLDHPARSRPVLGAIALISAASMAGLPPLIGFTAKEAGIAAMAEIGTVPLVVLVAASAITVAYSARFVRGIFGGAEARGAPDPPPRPSHAIMIAPVVLAVGTVVGGLTGHWLTGRLETFSGLLPGPRLTLALWHGWTLPVQMTLLYVLAGLALYAVRGRISAMQSRAVAWTSRFEAERAYGAFLRALDRFAVEVTGRIQRGSLPTYLTVILVIVVLLPGWAVLQAIGNHTGDYVWHRSLAQPFVAVFVIVAGIMTVRSRRRLRAAILAGGTGYGVAMLFTLQGAPDLALTQVLVETFMLVTLVLVMRRLPPFFSDRPFTSTRYIRIGVGLAVGIVVSLSAWVAVSARNLPSVSEGFADAAVKYGGGKNIVNVTLVDIRAWDTLGELSVLVAAGTGIASLVFLTAGRVPRHHRLEPMPIAGETSPRTPSWLRGGPNLPPARRSLVFEVVTRVLFHPMIIFSLYLMFTGHNAPGGGFAGGLVAGLALMLRYLAGGRYELDEAAPLDAGVVLGSGLVVAVVSALAPTLLGGGVLQSAIIDVSLGFLGEWHLVTSVFFDIGVYLVVVGVSLDVLRSLGSRIDSDSPQDAVVP